MSDIRYIGLIEECAELIKEISKIERFGINYINPKSGRPNIEHLIEEMGDVVGHCAMLADHLRISRDAVTERAHVKIAKFKKRHNLHD